MYFHVQSEAVAARSKMERSVIIVNGFQSLTIITKHSNLDVAAVLYPPLMFRDKIYLYYETKNVFFYLKGNLFYLKEIHKKQAINRLTLELFAAKHFD